jgi:hypothetical protein
MTNIREVSVGGLCLEGTKRNNEANPSGQSFLISWPEEVMVIRPLREGDNKMSVSEQIRRRREAIEIFERNLPELVPRCDLVMIQGYEGEESLPLLGRLMPRYEAVERLTETSGRKIVADKMLCRRLRDLNLFFLQMATKEKKFYDQGNPGGLGKKIPLLGKFLPWIISDNVMIGRGKERERIIFCDPDWYEDKQRVDEVRGRGFFYEAVALFAFRSAFFAGVITGHEVKSRWQRVKEKFEQKVESTESRAWVLKW